ncbi:MAG: hypothetical protein JOZ39_03175 [Chloroflexi bacterium]|nr:hypothetical protein [Chloroflexota bacterium]
MRVAIPYALISTIAGEMLVGARGLGYLLSRASGYLEVDELDAALIIVMALGVILNLAIGMRSRNWQATEQMADRGW